MLDIIKSHGPVSGHVALRSQWDNDQGRYQHLGSYMVCYRHLSAIERLRSSFAKHPTVVIEKVENGMVFKDYSTSQLPWALHQKIGLKVKRAYGMVHEKQPHTRWEEHWRAVLQHSASIVSENGLKCFNASRNTNVPVRCCDRYESQRWQMD